MIVRINAGGPAYTDSSNNNWSADFGYTGGNSVDWGSVNCFGDVDFPLFRTERYGPDLKYTVAVPNDTYTVRLHFCENYVNSSFPNAGIGYRVFSVQANGVTIASNVDVLATSGSLPVRSSSPPPRQRGGSSMPSS
jgi:large repetitive protein